MVIFDYPLENLRLYLPDRNELGDFDDFWSQTLQETSEHPLEPLFTSIDYGIKTLNVFDVTYSGYLGQRVKGWLLLPSNTKTLLPCIVEFIGYGGGRSFPYNWLIWSSCGYAHFVMDTRGQGSDKRHGDTPDIEPEPANPQLPRIITCGILSPKTHYYHRVFVDAVRAMEAARSFPKANKTRIAAKRGNKGRGISFAVAELELSVDVA